VKVGQLLYGIATFVPGISAIFGRGGGDSQSARYCYSVYLRHLKMAMSSGLTSCPKVVAELGPGNSIGIGLAALIAGSERYHAFDVVAHASIDRNLTVFEELVALFRARADVPGGDELPQVAPVLSEYGFPAALLDEAHLAAALDDARLDRIRESIRHPGAAGSMIDYRAPWFAARVVERDGVDMVFSQAVLEHVDDLPTAYRAMWQWLRPGGFLSHQIDFRCHNTAHDWNGHWRYSDRVWSLIKGRRYYLLNREPYSTHLKLMADNGFRVVAETRLRLESRLDPRDLADRFRHLTDDDLTTGGAYVRAIKELPPSPDARG
jgi:SAM-dependent methyltransferase